MHLMRLLLLLISVNLMAVAWAEPTANLRGPKEFDAPLIQRLGPITPQDTLWRLAEQARPDKRVNMYQVMYALYQKNPGSFLDNNFNHLVSGAYLDIPTVREMLAINALEAQRKSENDDRVWAEKIRKVAQTKVEDVTARQQDVAKARQEITEEMSRVEVEQTARLADIRERLTTSMANVETIVQENSALKEQLGTVVTELSAVKQQLDKDSEIQTQLQQLLLQQSEMLEQQREQIRKQEEGFNFAETWQKFANSQIGWITAAAMPGIMMLYFIVMMIRRKGQKTAAVVSAATAAPMADPHYRSPLPPLDDSLDFDESSLINLDDSLLNDVSSGIRLDDDDFNPAPKAKAAPMPFDADDLLDDSLELPVGNTVGSNAFDLDDLLDDPADTPPVAAKTDFDVNNILAGDDLSALFESAEDETEFTPKAEFDPNNILSGNDLSSLFDNLTEEDDEDPDAIFAQAMAAQAQAPAVDLAEPVLTAEDTTGMGEEPDVSSVAMANAAAESFEMDELLEEIELDLPGESDELTPVELDDDEFDIDALVAETQSAPNTATAPTSAAATDDDFDIDALLAATPQTDNTDVPVQEQTIAESVASSFDSSDLDAFAESLAEETLPEQLTTESADDETDSYDTEMPPSAAVEVDEATQEVEDLIEEFDISDLAIELDAEAADDELDDILNEVAEIRAQSAAAQQIADLKLSDEALDEAQSDFAEAELTAADVSAMLVDEDEAENSEDPNEPSLNAENTESADLAEAEWQEELGMADDLPAAASEPATEDPDAWLETLEEADLAAESAAETEYLNEFAELEQTDSDSAVEMPDLQQSDDNSVSRMYEALSSVERPSKVLAEYPELDMLDELEDGEDLIFEADPDSEEFETFVDEDDDDSVEQIADQAPAEHDLSDEDIADLLAEPAEIAADESNLTELEDSQFDDLLAELDQFPEQDEQHQQDTVIAAAALAELSQAQQSQQKSNDTVVEHDLPDYVNIDKLLAASEDEQESQTLQPSDLNIDVGLADFEDLIAADEAGDVDSTDNGFAGRLDLVRAYIEIGDQDSAKQLVKEIIASDAPGHVKQEAQTLLTEL